MARFRIQDVELEATPGGLSDSGAERSLRIASVPRPYTVEFAGQGSASATVEGLIRETAAPLVMIDRKVQALHFAQSDVLSKVPTLVVDAEEQFKTIEGSLAVCEFLQDNKATKSTHFYVIGGGIIQDVGGFAAGIYKRGIPWTYVPTTLLAQGDSGIGAKTGLNYKSTKNLLAIFSAPRRVVIHTGFLDTLSEQDLLSGLGEIFRLHVTGGPEFLNYYEQTIPRYVAGDKTAVEDLVRSALSAKKAIIERDEFEVDLRRCMNYGHSVGHAFEVLCDHTIPHGTAVVIGMLIENQVAISRGILAPEIHQRILAGARPLINDTVRSILSGLKVDSIVDLLARDKKAEAGILKLIVLETVGQIRFIDLPLEPATADLLGGCLRTVLSELA